MYDDKECHPYHSKTVLWLKSVLLSSDTWLVWLLTIYCCMIVFITYHFLVNDKHCIQLPVYFFLRNKVQKYFLKTYFFYNIKHNNMVTNKKRGP